MDYEKKYKEALELARVAAFNGHQSLMEGIFPELAESEDEKVRKEIISYLKLRKETSPSIPAAIGSWIAWLEKQGEQKPAWSEEDQNALEDVREAVVHYWGGETQDILLYWLKSIKQKIKGE